MGILRSTLFDATWLCKGRVSAGNDTDSPSDLCLMDIIDQSQQRAKQFALEEQSSPTPRYFQCLRFQQPPSPRQNPRDPSPPPAKRAKLNQRALPKGLFSLAIHGIRTQAPPGVAGPLVNVRADSLSSSLHQLGLTSFCGSCANPNFNYES